jgi:2-oxoglutarate ferredoxin oxidoreductase subunit alpha
MDRLSKKWETAKTMVPEPHLYQASNASEIGMIFFGTSQYSCEEAMDLLAEESIQPDALRLRAFPFTQEVASFIEAHKLIFVVEQNRDAQLKSLILIELGVDPGKLISVLNYNGLPITAEFIAGRITEALNPVLH